VALSDWPEPFTPENPADDFTWEQFWVWAQRYQFSDKEDIARWLGRAIDDLTPRQIRGLLIAEYKSALPVREIAHIDRE
jgi:hypothetical protein